MNMQDFDQFCLGKAMSDQMKESFYDFVWEKFKGRIPENANLEELWKEFNRTLTNKFLSE